MTNSAPEFCQIILTPWVGKHFARDSTAIRLLIKREEYTPGDFSTLKNYAAHYIFKVSETYSGMRHSTTRLNSLCFIL